MPGLLDAFGFKDSLGSAGLLGGIDSVFGGRNNLLGMLATTAGHDEIGKLYLGNELQQKNQTRLYQSLIQAGVEPHKAMLAAINPKAMESALPGVFPVIEPHNVEGYGVQPWNRARGPAGPAIGYPRLNNLKEGETPGYSVPPPVGGRGPVTGPVTREGGDPLGAGRPAIGGRGTVVSTDIDPPLLPGESLPPPPVAPRPPMVGGGMPGASPVRTASIRPGMPPPIPMRGGPPVPGMVPSFNGAPATGAFDFGRMGGGAGGVPPWMSAAAGPMPGSPEAFPPPPGGLPPLPMGRPPDAPSAAPPPAPPPSAPPPSAGRFAPGTWTPTGPQAIPKAPESFEWVMNPDGTRKLGEDGRHILSPIAGGAGTHLPAEVANKVALIQSIKEDLPGASEVLSKAWSPGALGALEKAQWASGTSEIGRAQRTVRIAIEGAKRALSGAATPESEIKAFADYWMPRIDDGQATANQKLRYISNYISRGEALMLQGRVPYGSGPAAPGGGSPLVDRSDPLGLRKK